MNLLLLDAAEVDGDRASLRGRRAGHVREVLRARVGDRVRAGVVGGRRGSARIDAIAADAVELTIALDQPADPRPPVELILALPRPKVLSRTLQLAAAMGVARIDLINAWRVDKSYFQSPRLAPAALAEDCWLGCEQGATTWVPEIAVHRLLMPFLDGFASAASHRLLAHPRAAPPIENVVTGPGSVVVAVGPEGGWIDRELASFQERGFAPVTISERVLRTEAAVTAILAQLELLRRATS